MGWASAISAGLVRGGVLGGVSAAGRGRVEVASSAGGGAGAGWAGAYADGLVGQGQVGGVAVGLGEDRDHLHPQVLAGADDPQGDLTAVGDQDALEHRTRAQPVGSTRNSTWLNSTDCWFSTRTSA